MPIHEYRCRACQKTSEFLVGVGQGDAEIRCQHCGSPDLERILSSLSVRMADGSGARRGGRTCCGRDERCDNPPCADKGECAR